MCLSIPSRVKHIDENNIATVDTLGMTRKVTLDLIDEEVKVGEYVLIHVGFALGKIDKESALESLKIYEDIVDKMKSGEIDEFEGDMNLATKLD
ncbi:MAG: HypC/HybG/HupF family hydrogenase formation chaperone [Campylobacteraceae bacterium]|jgi:hydrogenase expression/formation protein HypC|nr:HypC/HybG/HupF family hydrogenase formation chaperone [Campylobacteraceae bacterium]